MTQSNHAAANAGADDGPSCCGVMGMVSVPLRFALGGLFLVAAWNKLEFPNGPKLFSANVQAFKLGLPDFAVRLATSITPWVEVIAGVCLILGIWTRAAASVFALMLAFVIVLIVSALARELNVDCGCFGDISPFCPPKVGLCHIVQDVLMLAAALAIALTPRHRLALTR